MLNVEWLNVEWLNVEWLCISLYLKLRLKLRLKFNNNNHRITELNVKRMQHGVASSLKTYYCTHRGVRSDD